MMKLMLSILCVLATSPLFAQGQTMISSSKGSKSTSVCKSLVADVILMIDISASVYNTIVGNRTFIRNVIDGFPIDGKSMRMGLVIFSTTCKTLVRVEDGTSKEPLYEALKKPWFPVWSTYMKDCINKVRVEDLQLDKGQKSGRKIVVLLITDEAVDDIKRTVEAVKRLQDEGVSFFMILTDDANPKNPGISKQLGEDSVVKAIRKAGTDDRVAKKLVDDVCSRTCSTDEKEIEPCAWDQSSNCVRKVEVTALEPDHPACKSFRASNRTLPCTVSDCKKACDNFKWGQWDQMCCGPDKGQKKQLGRNRTVPDKFFHPSMCPRVDSFLCVVQYTCDEMLLHVNAADQERTKGWYIICIVLMIILFILAIIALCFLLTSRRRSTDRFQRRLKAVGALTPLQDAAAAAAAAKKSGGAASTTGLSAENAKIAQVLADLPLFSSSYRAPSSGGSERAATSAKNKSTAGVVGGDPSDKKIKSAKRQDPSDKKVTKKPKT